MHRRTFKEPSTRLLRFGDESFRAEGHDLPFKLRDFWRWSGSDLLGNADRGVLAEFLVGSALDAALAPRLEWGMYDLLWDGITVEVKSAAYFQSWPQDKPSPISFSIARRHNAWDPVANKVYYADPAKRWAKVYVFCLLGDPEGYEPNPFDLDEWKFYVASKTLLDRKLKDQKMISLAPLKKLVSDPVHWKDLRKAIRRAAKK